MTILRADEALPEAAGEKAAAVPTRRVAIASFIVACLIEKKVNRMVLTAKRLYSSVKDKENCSRIIFEHRISFLRKFYIHNLNLH